MAAVALGSVRSCGVTTLAVGLAATWPSERQVLLVEADPAGGTIGAASGWAPEPGLVSLAAAARRGGDPNMVWEHCQYLPGGAAVLAGPALADQARNALGMLGPVLARLGELDADVLVDCGRIDPGSAALARWERADRLVLVGRPRLADLQALATWREAGPLDAVHTGLVMVGDGPYPDGEIAETLCTEVLARVPWDPKAADLLVVVAASARELRLAPLVRTVRTLAGRLAEDRVEAITPLAGEAVTGENDRNARESATVSVRSRAWRGWRANGPAASRNGSEPEGVAR